jgi:NAD(P)-dependent dehydrogenase (short-subunit alcohol dehydrogenase family)
MLFTEDDLRNLGDSAYKAFKQWCAENTAMASVEKFLASPEAAFITGTILTVDGGLTA